MFQIYCEIRIVKHRHCPSLRYSEKKYNKIINVEMTSLTSGWLAEQRREVFKDDD